MDRCIVIDRGAFTLDLYVLREEEFKQVRRYQIAVGGIGYETDEGIYSVKTRDKEPDWTAPQSAWVPEEMRGEVIPYGDPANPIKGRWLGLYDGVGVHGTDNLGSLGTAASHGCIRLSVPDVEDLFERTPIGTPVVIA